MVRQGGTIGFGTAFALGQGIAALPKIGAAISPAIGTSLPRIGAAADRTPSPLAARLAESVRRLSLVP
jgi:hypothetical protein